MSIHNIALTPAERGRLFASGVLGMREDVRPLVASDFASKKRCENGYGRVTDVARRFLAGEWPESTEVSVATMNGLNPQSFKQTVWKLRTGYVEPKRRTA